jgi:hypothetical protein
MIRSARLVITIFEIQVTSEKNSIFVCRSVRTPAHRKSLLAAKIGEKPDQKTLSTKKIPGISD